MGTTHPRFGYSLLAEFGASGTPIDSASPPPALPSICAGTVGSGGAEPTGRGAGRHGRGAFGGLHRWGIGAFLLLSSAAFAAPEPATVLTTPGIAPTRTEAVLWRAEPAAPEKIDPIKALEDPRAFVRYLDSKGGTLDVSDMPSADMAKALVQILLRADRTFMAEQLLNDAVAKWPEAHALRRARARVLISLGRPSWARGELEKVVTATPEDPTAHYLLGLAWLRAEPRDTKTDMQAVEALRKTLALDPNYQDPDGMNPTALRSAINRLVPQAPAGSQPSGQ